MNSDATRFANFLLGLEGGGKPKPQPSTEAESMPSACSAMNASTVNDPFLISGGNMPGIFFTSNRPSCLSFATSAVPIFWTSSSSPFAPRPAIPGSRGDSCPTWTTTCGFAIGDHSLLGLCDFRNIRLGTGHFNPATRPGRSRESGDGRLPVVLRGDAALDPGPRDLLVHERDLLRPTRLRALHGEGIRQLDQRDG